VQGGAGGVRPTRVADGEGVDVSYATLQTHRIVNVALHQEYSLGIVFTFS
jgi:hypothetical protein